MNRAFFSQKTLTRLGCSLVAGIALVWRFAEKGNLALGLLLGISLAALSFVAEYLFFRGILTRKKYTIFIVILLVAVLLGLWISTFFAVQLEASDPYLSQAVNQVAPGAAAATVTDIRVFEYTKYRNAQVNLPSYQEMQDVLNGTSTKVNSSGRLRGEAAAALYEALMQAEIDPADVKARFPADEIKLDTLLLCTFPTLPRLCLGLMEDGSIWLFSLAHSPCVGTAYRLHLTEGCEPLRSLIYFEEVID